MIDDKVLIPAWLDMMIGMSFFWRYSMIVLSTSAFGYSRYSARRTAYNAMKCIGTHACSFTDRFILADRSA
jgi:hypothetical protein